MSLCFTAALRGTPGKRVVTAAQAPQPGDLCWFPVMPDALYPSHLVYRDVVAALPAGRESCLPLFTQHVGRRDAAQREPGGMIAPTKLR